MIEFIQSLRGWIHQLTSPEFLQTFGPWLYALLAGVVFAETGLFTFFLPGDSLLFVAGVLVGKGQLSLPLLVALLATAAVAGDNTSYWIGRLAGPRIFTREKSFFLSKDHLDFTRRFYERHGKKTIVIARFVPIARTFAPVVAGVGAMQYGRFLAFDVLGGVLWTGGMTTAGYALGQFAWIRANIDLVAVAIVFVSILPGVIEVLRARRAPAPEAAK